MTEKKKPDEKQVVLYRYIQSGSYLAGIPRRDLTAAEFAKLSASDQERVLKSSIYTQEFEK